MRNCFKYSVCNTDDWFAYNVVAKIDFDFQKTLTTAINWDTNWADNRHFVIAARLLYIMLAFFRAF